MHFSDDGFGKNPQLQFVEECIPVQCFFLFNRSMHGAMSSDRSGESTVRSAGHALSPPPPGFHLEHDVLPESAWEEIREWLCLDLADENLGIDLSTRRNSAGQIIPWEASPQDQCRPVAQFGSAVYDYDADVVVAPCSQANADIPPILKRLLLNNSGGNEETNALIASQKWSQCIINAYGANSTSHIPWHFDDPAFGPVVLVYTFGEARPLLMRKGDADDNMYMYSAQPKHLSRYVLSGESREHWQHSVPAGKDWRVSITFRTLCG